MKYQKKIMWLVGIALVIAVGAYGYNRVQSKRQESGVYGNPVITTIESAAPQPSTLYAGEVAEITGKNFLGGDELMVNLIQIANNAMIPMQIIKLRDTSIVIGVPLKIDTNSFGGYKLQVRNTKGTVEKPVDVLPARAR